MRLDFTKINITEPRDTEQTKCEWEDFFEGEKFDRYQKMLSQINVIVGFGRGFWAGVHGYSYLVYHKGTQKFYWYLRDIESDTDVYFYEVDPEAEIFNMLNTLPIEGNFDEYDNELDSGMLYELSRGETRSMAPELTQATIQEVFGEDTEQMRYALMNFRPATQGTKYPHKEFHKKYFTPKFHYDLDEKAKKMNADEMIVFRDGNILKARIGNEVFELKK